MTHKFPFTALVGQEKMKTALILNLIYPEIGGVLIRGEKGTAKSTAVRALADLLPEEISVVNLPVSATEDRVVGSLDIKHALETGEKRFEPGLLSQAHGNILYADEVNLLEDHIVDTLLDAAAMGMNIVEREGISYSHPARFILVGTMNPEEGDLRPQLLDRFGLVTEVAGEREPEQRAEVVRRCLAFEQHPESFCSAYEEEEKALRGKIIAARERLSGIAIPDEAFRYAAKIGIACEVDGHRADITLVKTARALTAFDGEDEVRPEHITSCAPLVLPHRMIRKPFEERAFDLKDVIFRAGGNGAREH